MGCNKRRQQRLCYPSIPFFVIVFLMHSHLFLEHTFVEVDFTTKVTNQNQASCLFRELVPMKLSGYT